MTQDTKQPPAPLGVVYNTSMARADAALALAALYVSASRREARVDAISVNGSGLDAAIFCDIVARVYTGQTRASSNNVLPIGYDAGTAPAPNPRIVEGAVRRLRADGQPQYSRAIQSVTDTAAPDALLRNAVTLSVEAVVVLSAPATWLARSLALAGAAAQYRQRVKRVVIVDAGDLDRDAAALKSLTALLPSPPVVCGRDVGAALAAAKTRLAGGFTWTPANPVADAVSAADGGDVPLHDVAALHYALHPDSGFFTVTNGRLTVNQPEQAACLDALVSLATATPAPRSNPSSLIPDPRIPDPASRIANPGETRLIAKFSA